MQPRSSGNFEPLKVSMKWGSGTGIPPVIWQVEERQAWSEAAAIAAAEHWERHCRVRRFASLGRMANDAVQRDRTRTHFEFRAPRARERASSEESGS